MIPQIIGELINLNNSSNWKQNIDGKVKGFTKQSQFNSVISKGQTILDEPFEKVCAFISHDDTYKKMNDNCMDYKIIYEKPRKYKIIYYQIKTPFPFDNRDSLILQTIKAQKDIFILANKSCNYPKESQSKLVRSKVHIGGWIIERQGDKTKIINILDIDPMGNIPEIIKNKIATKRAEMLGQISQLMKKNGY